jgi:hypothetical protein
LWREWGAELRRKGKDYSAGVEELARKSMESVLDNPKKASISSRRILSRAELHQLLEEIIDDGTVHIEGIQQVLELLGFACRLAGTITVEEMRALRQASSLTELVSNSLDSQTRSTEENVRKTPKTKRKT